MSQQRHSPGRFISVMFLMTIVFAILWEQVVTDRLYNCTDDIGFGYFTPGGWLHGNVASVPEVKAGRSMSEPDVVKEGWGEPGLWRLWVACVAVSVAVSVLAARRRWKV